MPRLAGEAGNVPEDEVEGYVDSRFAASAAVPHLDAGRFGDLADDGDRTALAPADRFDPGPLGRVEDEDVALLGLVAPELHRAEAGVRGRNRAEVHARPEPRRVHDLRDRVGEPPRSHVVNGEDRVQVSEPDARVDDLLGASLHLRVVPLNGGKVELPAAKIVRDFRAAFIGEFELQGSANVVELGSVVARGVSFPRGAGAVRAGAGVGPGVGAGGGGPSAEPDQHGRAAQHRDERSRPQSRLRDVPGADPAHPARNHDRLVVAVPRPPFAFLRLLEGAEVPAERGPSELVVEPGGADGTLEHDVESARDVGRGAGPVPLPRPLEARNAKGRHAEPDEPGPALRAASGGRLVPDLAAGAGRGAREGGDRGGMVVGLHLHEKSGPLRGMAIDPGRGVGTEPSHGAAFDDRGIVVVGGEHPAGACRVGVPDHVEERPLRGTAVHRPGSVEYLVPAVLGVRLCEHHELGVGRVPAERAEPVAEPPDLVLVERQPEPPVRVAKGAFRLVVEGDPDERPRRGLAEEIRGHREVPGGGRGPRVRGRRFAEGQDALGHAVMERPERPFREGVHPGKDPEGAAFHAAHPIEAAVADDVGRLARPRRDRTRPRDDQDPGVAVEIRRLGGPGAGLRGSGLRAVRRRGGMRTGGAPEGPGQGGGRRAGGRGRRALPRRAGPPHRRSTRSTPPRR